MVRMAKISLGPSAAEKRARRASQEKALDYHPPSPVLHFKPDRQRQAAVPVADPAEIHLPPFRTLRLRLLRLRQLVDLVVRLDLEEDVIDVRRTVIQNIDRRGRVILAQTTPPVLKSMVGQKVEVTFLTFSRDRAGGRWVRLGYNTQVLNVIANYKLARNYRETVVMVGGPSQFHISTTRLAHRVRPTLDMDLRLFLMPRRSEVRLADLSGTGLSFRHSRLLSFAPGSIMRLLLTSGPVSISLVGKVVRTTPIKSRMLDITAVHFIDMDAATKKKMLQLVTEMDRHILAKRSGVCE